MDEKHEELELESVLAHAIGGETMHEAAMRQQGLRLESQVDDISRQIYRLEGDVRAVHVNQGMLDEFAIKHRMVVVLLSIALLLAVSGLLWVCL